VLASANAVRRGVEQGLALCDQFVGLQNLDVDVERAGLEPADLGQRLAQPAPKEARSPGLRALRISTGCDGRE
jgi:hypothetical protein